MCTMKWTSSDIGCLVLDVQYLLYDYMMHFS